MKGVRTTTNNPRIIQDMKNMVEALGPVSTVEITAWQHTHGKPTIQCTIYEENKGHKYVNSWPELVREVETRLKERRVE